MKKTYIVLLAASLITLLFVGCQATPEDETVVRKDLQQMLDMATADNGIQASLSEMLCAVDRYETNFEDTSGNIRVTVDADIVVPDADSIPIVRVKTQSFSQDTVDKMIDLLFDDGPLYDPNSLSELTKDDITELLTVFNQKKAELIASGMKSEKTGNEENDDETHVNSDDSGEDTASVHSGNQLDELYGIIALYEEKLKTAPENKTLVEVSGELISYESEGAACVSAGQSNEGGGITSINIVNDESDYLHSASFVNRGDFDTMSGMYYTEAQWHSVSDESDQAAADELEYPTISEEQAQQITDEFLEKIGVDYLECEPVEKVIGGSCAEYSGGIRAGNLLKAYRLQYVRKVSGAPVTYTNVTIAYDDTDDSVFWAWYYERMTFIVDDSGIVEMEWVEPYQLTDTITETTTILSFTKIQEVFEKMILINNGDYSDTRIDLNITEVRLGLMRITEQNNLMSGLLVPVWDFFGTATYYYENGAGNQESYTTGDTNESFLTINAIDGSMIDRNLGY